MIPQGKIDKAATDYSKSTATNGGEFDILDLQEFAVADFKAGAHFAETELQSIAVEFAMWANVEYLYEYFDEVWISLMTPELSYTPSELFAKFMEERNAQ